MIQSKLQLGLGEESHLAGHGQSKVGENRPELGDQWLGIQQQTVQEEEQGSFRDWNWGRDVERGKEKNENLGREQFRKQLHKRQSSPQKSTAILLITWNYAN